MTPVSIPMIVDPPSFDAIGDFPFQVATQAVDDPANLVSFGGQANFNTTTNVIVSVPAGQIFVIVTAVMTVGYQTNGAINSQLVDIKSGGVVLSEAIVTSVNPVDMAQGKQISIQPTKGLNLVIGSLSGNQAAVSYKITGFYQSSTQKPPPSVQQTTAPPIG